MGFRNLPLDPRIAARSREMASSAGPSGRPPARPNGHKPVSACALAKRLEALGDRLEPKLSWRMLPSGDMGVVVSFIVHARDLRTGEGLHNGLEA